jgi:hypothetical protein
VRRFIHSHLNFSSQCSTLDGKMMMLCCTIVPAFVIIGGIVGSYQVFRFMANAQGGSRPTGTALP